MRAYNPPTLRNIAESKILPLSENKLVIWAVKKVFFPHVFPRYSSAIIDKLHSTECRKYKNKNFSPCLDD